MRNYCEKCNKRRYSRFMKQSPITNKHYCYSVRGFEKTCFSHHVEQEFYRTLSEQETLEKYISKDKITAVKMSYQVDNNKPIKIENQLEIF